MQSFDLIVLGCGGFGSSVLFHAACQGARVFGLDRFPVAHDRGSSHGDTRIIRQAYFEHADYVPLLLRAYDLWRELEAETSRQLMTICGLIEAGSEFGEVVSGVRRAAAEHGLEIENYTASQARRRFPGFEFTDDMQIVFEPTAGYLAVEDCVRSHIELAQRHGAQIRCDADVRCWSANGSGVRVETSCGVFEADRLVITAGAWAGPLLSSTARFPTLEVRRKVVTWNRVLKPCYDVQNGGTAFLFELPCGVFYGFPSLDGQSLKLGEHSGGDLVVDPLRVDRTLRSSDVAPLSDFLQQHMPSVSPTVSRHSVCLYTMTPDANFLVDRHPEHERVFFGAGFSGHGFKFTSVIGQALADMALQGSTSLPLDFLGLARFGVR